jgi:hypothetical protein
MHISGGSPRLVSFPLPLDIPQPVPVPVAGDHGSCYAIHHHRNTLKPFLAGRREVVGNVFAAHKEGTSVLEPRSVLHHDRKIVSNDTALTDPELRM